MSHIPIGILTIVPEDGQISLDSLHPQPSGTAIILEGRIVMDDLENLPHTMCLFFGLTYALNLEYPQQLKYTFDFIQRVLLSLGHKSLKPKIQSLKNLLMQWMNVITMWMWCDILDHSDTFILIGKVIFFSSLILFCGREPSPFSDYWMVFMFMRKNMNTYFPFSICFSMCWCWHDCGDTDYQHQVL